MTACNLMLTSIPAERPQPTAASAGFLRRPQKRATHTQKTRWRPAGPCKQDGAQEEKREHAVRQAKERQ